jgi:hypothetical protein
MGSFKKKKIDIICSGKLGIGNLETSILITEGECIIFWKMK